MVRLAHHQFISVINDITGPTSTLVSMKSETSIQNNCYATVAVSSDTLPYFFTYNTNSPQNGNTAINLHSVTYVVSAKDSMGCTASLQVTVTSIDGYLSLQASVDLNKLCD